MTHVSEVIHSKPPCLKSEIIWKLDSRSERIDVSSAEQPRWIMYIEIIQMKRGNMRWLNQVLSLSKSEFANVSDDQSGRLWMLTNMLFSLTSFIIGIKTTQHSFSPRRSKVSSGHLLFGFNFRFGNWWIWFHICSQIWLLSWFDRTG